MGWGGEDTFENLSKMALGTGDGPGSSKASCLLVRFSLLLLRTPCSLCFLPADLSLPLQAMSWLDLRTFGLTYLVSPPRIPLSPHLPLALACAGRDLTSPPTPTATTHSSSEVLFSLSRMV